MEGDILCRFDNFALAGGKCAPARLLKAAIRYGSLVSLFIACQTALQLVGAEDVANLESYRKYALTHEGNVGNGMKLFNEEQKLICSHCHSLDGGATKAGPDLFAVGDK